MKREDRIEKLFVSMQAMGRAWKHHLIAKLGSESVSPMQLYVLMYLHHEQQATGKEISAAMQVSASATAQFLDGLSQQHLVHRESSTTDRRMAYFSLTAEGKAKVAALEKRQRQMLMETTADLTESEIDAMISAQQKIIKKIHSLELDHTGVRI